MMSHPTLSSLQHPLVKHLVKLRENRDYRYACQKILLSGKTPICELSPRFPLRTLLLEEGYECSVKAELIFYVSRQILKKVTGLASPEPIAAEINMPAPQEIDSTDFLLVLDQISDPGNLGTLLRTALGLGWDGVFLTPGCTDLFHEKALRAAKGATFCIPFKQGSWEELSCLLKKKQMKLLAADPSGQPLGSFKIDSPIALALGNETHGLAEEIKNMAKLIAIPMEGRINSLNVASAGAILMYALKGNLR